MTFDILDDLQSRDLLVQVSSELDIHQHLRAGRVVYAGFDPTADSLHVGSLVPLLALRRFQLAGHVPIVLIGGGTGLIGDPSGKAEERSLNSRDVVAGCVERLRKQVSQFLDLSSRQVAAKVVDNYEWLAELDAISLLRDIGKHFSVSSMMAKDSVRSRLHRAGEGISFTEFSYMILQAFDFLNLSRRFDCSVQIGGSDQWGNITAGIDLVKRLDRKMVYGATLPLVTKADGTKFGKTEAGTIWLDPAKTSPYAMYQFWLNAADADVVSFLKYFTLLSSSEIKELAETVEQSPEKREAQQLLAAEVTRLVHGEAGLGQARRITSALFQEDFAGLPEDELVQALAGAPRTEVPQAELGRLSLADLLVRTGLARSKRHARELTTAAAIRVNGRHAPDADAPCTSHSVLYSRYLVLTRGKKTHHLVVGV